MAGYEPDDPGDGRGVGLGVAAFWSMVILRIPGIRISLPGVFEERLASDRIS